MSETETEKESMTGTSSDTGTEGGLARDGKKTGAYYDKWGKFAKEADKQLDVEDEKETEENKKALGIDDSAPKTATQKADVKKHHALKEAKKLWDKKKELEEDNKKSITDLIDQTMTINQSDVGECIVVDFSGCKGCTFTLPDTLKLVKVFVAGCDDCTFSFSCQILTAHVELSHCNNVIVNVDVPLATLQADICENLTVNYAQNCMRQGDPSSDGKGSA